MRILTRHTDCATQRTMLRILDILLSRRGCRTALICHQLQLTDTFAELSAVREMLPDDDLLFRCWDTRMGELLVDAWRRFVAKLVRIHFM